MQRDFQLQSDYMIDSDTASGYHWQALRLFNLYRFFLSMGFLIIIHYKFNISFISDIDYVLYKEAAYSYLFISICFLIISILFKTKYSWQANIPIFVDIVAIIIIMHASGGLISGVGILLIVIVAAHSLLMPGKLSILSAATATIGLLIEHSYIVFTLHNPINLYTQVGLLGSVIFATSIVTNLLALRARQSQLIVENQALQLATSQQLNAHIVSAMHAGVLVIDNQNHIRLINMAAKKLLDLSSDDQITTLKDLPVTFEKCLVTWQKMGKNSPSQQIVSTGPEVRFSFHALGKPLPVGTLIFIYNVSEETRQAQDLKLASLGHLTANIAHELRNPLGAASHAAQLLVESNDLNAEDRHLLKMIKDSCDRMNTVIQNVLSLSGRKSAKTQQINLIPWLSQFINNLVIPHIPHPEVTLQYDRNDILIEADTSQLTQILINLCENGLRYSLKKTQKATLTLSVKTTTPPDTVYIDVIDQGEGIPSQVVKHIFEPFFTTEKTGSGLGLYIAKELSQMNGARLDYAPTNAGCQFRLTISQRED